MKHKGTYGLFRLPVYVYVLTGNMDKRRVDYTVKRMLIKCAALNVLISTLKPLTHGQHQSISNPHFRFRSGFNPISIWSKGRMKGLLVYPLDHTLSLVQGHPHTLTGSRVSQPDKYTLHSH